MSDGVMRFRWVMIGMALVGFICFLLPVRPGYENHVLAERSYRNKFDKQPPQNWDWKKWDGKSELSEINLINWCSGKYGYSKPFATAFLLASLLLALYILKQRPGEECRKSGKYPEWGVSLIISVFLICWVGLNIIPDESAQNSSQEDPLMPYIHPQRKVTSEEFDLFLRKLSPVQRQALALSLCKNDNEKALIEQRGDISADELKKNLTWISSHWITYKFNDFNYHETVVWTAEKVGIPKAECESATTFQLEHRICEKMLEDAWDKLSSSERQKKLVEAGLSSSEIAGMVTMSGGALVAAIATSAKIVGFPFYILAAKALTGVAATVTGASAAATIGGVSLFCGPVGWSIAGVAIAGGSLFIGPADMNRTAAFIIQAHYLKVGAIKNSGKDINRYIIQ